MHDFVGRTADSAGSNSDPGSFAPTPISAAPDHAPAPVLTPVLIPAPPASAPAMQPVSSPVPALFTAPTPAAIPVTAPVLVLDHAPVTTPTSVEVRWNHFGRVIDTTASMQQDGHNSAIDHASLDASRFNQTTFANTGLPVGMQSFGATVKDAAGNVGGNADGFILSVETLGLISANAHNALVMVLPSAGGPSGVANTATMIGQSSLDWHSTTSSYYDSGSNGVLDSHHELIALVHNQVAIDPSGMLFT